LLLCAAAMPFLLMSISQVVQIKSPNALKYTAYESGMPLFSDAKLQFDVKFYMYALLFIVFDIETVFLFPWAVAFSSRLFQQFNVVPGFNLTSMAFVEMLVFVAILFLGLIYAWKKDALRWQ
jgi:NADH-quinone oxidoreductase subunit A